MKRDTRIVVDEIGLREIESEEEHVGTGTRFSTWWGRFFYPPEPPTTASLFERERARRGRTASVLVVVLLLASLILFPMILMNVSLAALLPAFLSAVICALALFLNKKGAIEVAGILVLALVYGAQAYIVSGYQGGMTLGRLSLLDFTIVPDVLVLAFFPVSSLFLVTLLDIAVTWAIVVFTPHNATISLLLKTAPYQIFAHVYILQVVVAVTLYLWARSSEQAIRRADRAEEIARLEKREKEHQQQELERMRQLNLGIQAILETHIAVANGDLNARAPLNQEHVLWQLAFALNNLIGRIQRLTNIETELKNELSLSTEFMRALQKRDLVVPPKQTEKIRALPAPSAPKEKTEQTEKTKTVSSFLIPRRMKRF